MILKSSIGDLTPSLPPSCGLGPREDIGNSDQLRYFGDQLGKFFGIPTQRFTGWFDAFSMLAALTKEGHAVILFDEISWMAKHDKDFPGVLKGFWDTHNVERFNF